MNYNLIFMVWMTSFSSFVQAAAIDPSHLFTPVENTLKPSPLWLQNIKPFPTNAWYTNFILTPPDNKPSEPVNIFPYLAQINTQGMSLSYHYPFYYKDPDTPDIISAFYYQVINPVHLGVAEPMKQYGVASVHNSRINLQWKNDSDAMLTIPLVRGSPYLTTIFSKATPTLNANLFLQSIQEKPDKLELNFTVDHDQIQTWFLYSEHPITWKTEKTADKTVVTADKPYTGWIRLILQKDTKTNLENNANILDNYSQNIPLDYQQTYALKDKNLTWSWHWQTQNGKAPLILSLPHHRQTWNKGMTNATIHYQSIKGELQGEMQSNWDFKQPAIPLLFLEKRKPTEQQTQALKKALQEDVEHLLKYPFPDDSPYQVGKRLTRVARLVLIASYLHENQQRDQLLTLLKTYLQKKMRDKNSWNFEYDTTWGGIIPSIDDYGARHYTDHHYHYSYWVYTFAVIAKLDKTWLNTPLPQANFTPKQWIEALIKDYANMDSTDAFFPVQRHQDDYLGHSWASGLTAFADGQNQQSSSEAVHAYYALALYAKAIQDLPLQHWGEFLLTREVQGAQLYWQIPKNNPVYSENFKAHNHVLGNLSDSKVDSNAFFVDCKTQYRCGLEFSFGMQMLPFTAVSYYLLDKTWLTDSKPEILRLINQHHGKTLIAWQWLLMKGLAPILTNDEKKTFFSEVIKSTQEEYDNGDSKTNTLYFLLND